jgi:hypothetical protein
MPMKDRMSYSLASDFGSIFTKVCRNIDIYPDIAYVYVWDGTH